MCPLLRLLQDSSGTQGAAVQLNISQATCEATVQFNADSEREVVGKVMIGRTETRFSAVRCFANSSAAGCDRYQRSVESLFEFFATDTISHGTSDDSSDSTQFS